MASFPERGARRFAMQTVHVPGRIEPYPLQLAVHNDPHRIRVVRWGRRGGKSLMGLNDGLYMSYVLRHTGTPDPRGVVVAPTNQMLRENWWMVQQKFAPYIAQVVVSESRILLRDHLGQIDFKSTEAQGGAGRGAGYHWAVLDEAARIPKEAWEADLRPALADTRGQALIISTPKGLNWFYDLYQEGILGDPDIGVFHASTLECWRSRYTTQPEVLASMEAEWSFIQRTTSEGKFREEYLAEFLQAEGQLFSLKPALARGQLREAIPTRHYVAGVDVARKEDWMVTVILELESQQLVALTRSRHQDWALQKAASLHLLRQYPNLLVHIDSTGVGDPIAQDFRAEGIEVIDVCFTPKIKSELVENLLMAVDQCYLGLPDQPETRWLMEELRQYECLRQPSGHLKYGAPEGKHDDGVTALMLAAWGLHGQWRHPQLDDVLEPAWWQRPGMDWEWLDYERQVRAFRQRFPDRPLPMHPTDLAWTLLERRN